LVGEDKRRGRAHEGPKGEFEGLKIPILGRESPNLIRMGVQEPTKNQRGNVRERKTMNYGQRTRFAKSYFVDPAEDSFP